MEFFSRLVSEPEPELIHRYSTAGSLTGPTAVEGDVFGQVHVQHEVIVLQVTRVQVVQVIENVLVKIKRETEGMREHERREDVQS